MGYKKKYDGFLLSDTLKKNPIQAYDVGAHGGVVDHWRPYLPYLDIDAFEPNKEECLRQSRMSPPNIHWHAIGLARETGAHKLHVLGRTSGSSFYPMNEVLASQYTTDSYRRLQSIVDIDCVSIKDFAAKYKRPLPNLIKLDTQGSELDILRGIPDASWREVYFVESEVEFAEAYVGQPLFGDMQKYLSEQGFFLAEMKTHHAFRVKGDDDRYYTRKYLHTHSERRLSAMLWAADALYFRSPESAGVFNSRDAFLKYLMITYIYSCFDLSLWLLEQAQAKSLFQKAEMDSLWAELYSRAPRPKLNERVDFIGRVMRRAKYEFRKVKPLCYWDKRGDLAKV